MLDDQTIATLKSTHGPKLGVVTAANGAELVFRKPRRVEYDRWFDKREESPTAAARELAQSTLIYPDDRNAMIAVLDEQPSLLMCGNGIIDTITDLAGAVGGAAQKKIL